MINQEVMDKTIIGKTAKRMNIKFNIYYAFLLILNIFALFISLWDAKGLVILFFTFGFSVAVHLMYTQREEQRITNALLEELLERDSPISTGR